MTERETSEGGRDLRMEVEKLPRMMHHATNWVPLNAVLGLLSAPVQTAASVEAFDLSEIPRDAAKRERARRSELAALMEHARTKTPCADNYRCLLADLEKLVAAPTMNAAPSERCVSVNDLKAFRSVIDLHLAISPLDSYAEGVRDAYRACANQLDKFINDAALAEKPTNAAPIDGATLNEIAFRHSKIYAGVRFCAVFDWDGIAKELNGASHGR